MSIAFNSATSASPRTIEYSQPGGTPLYMDVSIPDGPGPFAAAIVVHGGGWVRGDRRVDVAPLLKPLSDAGIAWFSIDYRLSSNIMQFGTAIEDVRKAIRFVKARAAEFNVDANRVAIIGESAGGQLAAMAVLEGTGAPKVKAFVSLYAPMDLVALAKETTFIPPEFRESLRGTPFENVIVNRLGQLSPIAHIGPAAPPFLFIHGTADRLVPFSQSQNMYDRLKAAGIGCELYPVAQAGHGIRWWETSHPTEAQAYKDLMVRWLQKQLSVNAPHS